MGFRRYLATADSPLARAARRTRALARRVSLPVPLFVVRPFVWLYLGVRAVYDAVIPAVITGPYFRARCRRTGRGLRTGVYLHYIEGAGDILIGDFVRVDGKCAFGFAARFADRPTLTIGDHSSIGHNVSFIVARSIEIGRYCHIAAGTRIFDSAGHPLDPAKRLANLPPDPTDVKPVRIDDNVWIGANATIFPGVHIGSGAVVATASVVTADVPPNTLVAGYPARRIAALGPQPTSEEQSP
jgi:acetyltransferase-like isoleucine patch superfamily enzyme